MNEINLFCHVCSCGTTTTNLLCFVGLFIFVFFILFVGYKIIPKDKVMNKLHKPITKRKEE